MLYLCIVKRKERHFHKTNKLKKQLMKTTIQTIERTICIYYKSVMTYSYYVEDANEACQKIVIFGRYYNKEKARTGYFYGSILGNKHTEAEIMHEIEMTDNKYEAKYNFFHYIN